MASSPSNTGHGYVLRRLLRRALTAVWRGEVGSSLTLRDLPPDLVRHTAGRFGQVIEPSQVSGVLVAEERRFRELLIRGRRLLQRLYPSGR
jgi:alanyl-tRNA synthetase